MKAYKNKSKKKKRTTAEWAHTAVHARDLRKYKYTIIQFIAVSGPPFCIRHMLLFFFFFLSPTTPSPAIPEPAVVRIKHAGVCQDAVGLRVFDTDIGNEQHIHTVEGGKGKSEVSTTAVIMLQRHVFFWQKCLVFMVKKKENGGNKKRKKLCANKSKKKRVINRHGFFLGGGNGPGASNADRTELNPRCVTCL